MDYRDWGSKSGSRGPYAPSWSRGEPPWDGEQRRQGPARDELDPAPQWNERESPWVPRPRPGWHDQDARPADQQWYDPAPRPDQPPWDDEQPWRDEPALPAPPSSRGWQRPAPWSAPDDPSPVRPAFSGRERHLARVYQPGHAAARSEVSRRRDIPTDDDVGPIEGGYASAMAAAAGWFAVPLVLYLLWALTLGSTPEAGCIDAAGRACPADRAAAIADLINALPRLAAALTISLAAAAVLRWASATWRPITIGFAGAVVGAGAATVLFSVLGGAPLG
ncbi:MAG TPA: hypothetical protein VGJ63_07740 [Micromonosporaceae bacterium]